MKVMSKPDGWLKYTQRKDMKNKRLGVFAHCFVENGDQPQIKDVYKKIVDIAIEEDTCIVLSASQSLVLPNHNLLYEEWSDYDEFFNVQLKRKYRNAFFRWLDPIRKGPVSPEFTHIFASSGEHPMGIAPQNAYTSITSAHIEYDNYHTAYLLLNEYVAEAKANGMRAFVNAHQSLNDPNHFLLYEVWLDFSELMTTGIQDNIEIRKKLDGIAIENSEKSSVELFQVYYDPQKYQPS